MTACDDVQISLEMLRKGVTPLVPESEARAHAATCTECAAYAATLEENKSMMNASDLALRDGFDADAVLKKTLAELPTRRDVYKLIAFVSVVFVVGVGAAYVGGHSDLLTARLIGLLVGTAVVGIAAFAYRRQQVRVLAELAGKPMEILAARRDELAQRRRAALVAIPLFVGLIAYNAYSAYVRGSGLRLGVTIAYALILISFIRSSLDARRELRTLDQR